MEKKTNYNIEIPFTLHNKYEITVSDKEGNVIKQAIAYNQASSSAYLAHGYIDTVEISGSRTESKYIEPYRESDDLAGDTTEFWDREGLPELQGNNFVSCYHTQIKFFNISAGYIDRISLRSGGSIVSTVELKDIEGYPIKITYEDNNNITIHVFIYFSADMSKRNTNDKFYPIKWYGPSGSVLGGCCGKQIDLLEQREVRMSHYKNIRGDFIRIDDGYMPKAVNKYLALSRAPVPKIDENKYLTGVINNYTILKPNIIETYQTKIFKNSTETNNDAGDPILGLIRCMVLPGIGVIDMRDICNKKGPGGKGVFEGITYYKGSGPCYIPEEYVQETDNSLISIKKNAFYNAHVIVRRFKTTMDSATEEVPLGEVFFSDITEDGRKRRCMGFSQHVPLTEDYCGAETVIPCGPGNFVNSSIRYYGYYITYTGGDIENTYLKADYAVTGQIVTIPYSGQRMLQTFPYKLEYSYNGVDFTTAVEFTDNSTPYEPVYFGAIAAPIWRLSSGVNAATIDYGNNTTHSDKYVANAAGTKTIGYDPLFIFIGWSGRSADPTVPNGVKIAKTKSFTYGEGMGKLDRYTLLVPYLGFEKDKVYFSSDFKEGLTTKGDN